MTSDNRVTDGGITTTSIASVVIARTTSWQRRKSLMFAKSSGDWNRLPNLEVAETPHDLDALLTEVGRAVGGLGLPRA